ncbi:MAG: tetratricopeptide repeat protein [Phycisphaerae bacterium]
MTDVTRDFGSCMFCNSAAAPRALSPVLLECSDCGSVVISQEFSRTPRPTLLSDAIREIAPQAILSGKYQLLGKLGEGGQGETYLARHLFLNYSCTIKISHEGAGGVRSGNSPATQEARLGLMVHHPNVVQVFDCDEVNGRTYIVLEYVDGMSVFDLCNVKPRLPWVQVTHYLDMALAGIGAIHDAGIIHRDLRPHNLLVDSRQTLRIADLGVALLVPHAGRAALGNHVANGTVNYVAPEFMQVNAAFQATSDLYSLGISAYEMLVGATPFSSGGIFSRLLQEDNAALVWPDDIRSETPEWLRNLIARMVSPEPDARPQSAGEVRMEIAARLERSVSALRASRSSKPPRGIGILPFGTVGADDANEWMAQSVTDAIFQELQQIPAGFIVGPQELAARLSASTGINGAQGAVELRNAARALGVGRLVSGEVKTASSAISVNVVVRNFDNDSEASHVVMGEAGKLGILQQQIVQWILTHLAVGAGDRSLEQTTRSATQQQQFAEARRRFDAGEYAAAAEIAGELVDTEFPEPEALGLLGVIRARQGEYREAEACYARQVERAAALQEPHWILEARANLGVLHYLRGEFEQARMNYEQAVVQAEKLERTAELAQILNNLGFVYVKIGLLKQAEESFRKSIDLHLNNGALLALIGPYNGLGNALVERDALDAAEQYFRKALAIAQEMRDQPNLGMTYVHLGSLHRQQGLRNLAQQDYALAMSALEGTAFWSGFAKLYDAMAELNLELKQPQEAIRCVDRRIELARQQRNRRAEADAWLQRSRAQHLAGDEAGVEESMRRAEALGEQSG